jgi:hypothetical protein
MGRRCADIMRVFWEPEKSDNMEIVAIEGRIILKRI